MFITYHQCLALRALILYSVIAFAENATHRDAVKFLAENLVLEKKIETNLYLSHQDLIALFHISVKLIYFGPQVT